MKVQRWLFNGNPGAWYRLSPAVTRFNHPNRPHAQFSTQNSPSVATSCGYHPLKILDDASIENFRKEHFIAELPVILPRRHFRDLPAFGRWFQSPPSEPNVSRLNTTHLEQHGADAIVPLELTQPSTEPDKDGVSFRQFHAPLSLFLEWMRTAEEQSQSVRLYLAQCQLSDLPQTLRNDFATPELVSQAGNGDVYDTNVWIGYPPTYTPLHRDPNPNLFVQLAGRKIVRLIAPDDGQALFASVRRQLGRSGSREAAVFRGSEMMQGRERTLLEKEVWDDGLNTASSARKYVGYEAQLEAGDGMFIPKGWWHSIKGVGHGVTASNPPSVPPNSRTTKSTTSTQSIYPPNPPPAIENPAQIEDMHKSILTRTTLLHLILNPFLTIPTRASTTITPPTILSQRLTRTPIAYPQCPSNLYQEKSYSTMSSSTDQIQQQQSDNAATDSATEKKPEQYLALPDSSSADQTQQLDLSGDGSTVKLDHLGPLVVNQDGTLSRISNWAQMAEIEKKNTLRVLGKRNKQRMEALRAAQGAQEEGK